MIHMTKRLAQKNAVLKMRSYIAEGQSFHQETTLSGKSDATRIKKAKQQGYRLTTQLNQCKKFINDEMSMLLLMIWLDIFGYLIYKICLY
ncbi:hypothetical protein AB3K25_01395 [Leuconostoc sp. MS02]|uniref:Transposase n=1 Tax=Leuconostoc aquikimchii TaxID=3236804 RepID=A0ABV3S5S6_9LACO